MTTTGAPMDRNAPPPATTAPPTPPAARPSRPSRPPGTPSFGQAGTPRWPALPAPPARLLAALVAGTALLFDRVVRVPVGVGASLWCVGLVAVILSVIAPGRQRPLVLRPAVFVTLVGALGFAAALSVRATPWLVPLNALAVLVLCSAAIVASHGDRPWSLPATALLRWAVQSIESWLVAPVRAVQLVRGVLPAFGRRRGAGAVRAVLLAAPVLVVVGALLVSADAFLASFLDIDVDAGPAFGHVVLVAIGAWITLGIALPAAPLPPVAVPTSAFAAAPWCPPDGDESLEPLGRRRRVQEAVVLLGGLAVLYTIFVSVAVAAVLTGDEYVRRQTGLSYAEYARRGFFQLLAVAAITFVVLVALRARATPSRLVRALALVVVALIGAIVVVALSRLGLYEQAYGATMLRRYSTWFAWWLGAVLVAVGLAWAGLLPGRRWLGPTVATLAFLWLAGVNAANPEAVVVARNVDLFERTGRFDADYVATLGIDATPTIFENLRRLDARDVSTLLDGAVCRPRSYRPVLGWNVAARRADRVVALVCPPAT